MTFQEVGEILRHARLEKGLSIEEVMHETKVSRRHVEAIEDGRVEDLPHPVYVKGFVNTYARMLGVEVKGLGAAVDQAFASVLEEEEFEERRRYRSKGITLNSSSRRGPWSRIFVVLLLLALLGGTGYAVWWYFFQSGGSSVEDMQPAVVTPQPEQQAPASEPAPRPAPEPVYAPTPQPEPEPLAPPLDLLPQSATERVGEAGSDVAVAPPRGEPLAESEGAPEDGDPVQEAPPAEEVVDGGNAGSAQAVEQPTLEPIVIASSDARAADRSSVNILEVFGNGQNDCWIEAKVDSDFTTDFYVRSGERVQIWFTRALAVKFGNIGEVALSYNGSPFTTSVPASGVKTLRFPPSP